MLDWDRISELREEIGVEDFAEVVALFLEETGEALSRLAAGRPTLAADLHFLKGAALNLGFADLARMAAEGEARAGQGGAPDLASLAACYRSSRDAFLRGAAAKGYLAAAPAVR
ncbi:Hpt domain-containing protein [Mangrovicoccus algicola]|uniref:Hpt domain-containing protein n=1 Tax=Mangrovicoccus algicola TaxID=2771008 RepID=A0A8J6Z5R3_9RHOB|nr:Hpt domain-containing protein [Mangrovicoccus algicola]MBE3638244.1 Hpt domain-containing protein [Mangrovicoccus algicola]